MISQRLSFVLDQALSSASNFLVLLLVAREASRDEFGVIATALGALTLFLTLRQAALGELVVVRSREDQGDVSLGEVNWLSLVWGFGALGAAVCMTLSLGGPPSLVLALLPTPLIFIQDAARFAAFARGRPQEALLLDLLWLLGQVLVTVCLGYVAGWTATVVVTGWVSAGAFVGLLSLLHSRSLTVVGSVRWAMDERAYLSGAVAQAASSFGVGYVITYGIAAFSSPAQAGALRAGQTLFGPLNSFIVAERVRILKHWAGHRLHSPWGRLAVRFRAEGLLIGAAYTAAIWLCPASFGSRVLGSTWDGAHTLVPVLGVLGVAATVSQTSSSYLSAARRVRESLAIRWMLGGLMVAGTAGLVPFLEPSQAASVAFAAAMCCALIVTEVVAYRVSRKEAAVTLAIDPESLLR